LAEGHNGVIVAGCDIGALTTKAAVMEDGALLGLEMVRSRAKAAQSATDAIEVLLSKADLKWDDIKYCVCTGYGRNVVPFAQANISEISCHGRGAQWLVPSVRTVIDGGGQDCKALLVNEKGMLRDFRMNFKCAAGTGRALEVMAESLGIDVSELGPLSLESKNPAVLRKPCCILTQIEIRRLLFGGRNRADIAAGINEITALQILSLARDLDVEKDIAFTGGMAKNIGLARSLERALGVELVRFPQDPQLIGAIGAALFAADRARAKVK
jgi:predicted CoA-substrate-specific enzyme activase